MPLWSNLSKVFEFGGQWGSATIRLVEGDDAAFILKKVDLMLEDSMKVLQSHERLLNQCQYSTFTIKHRRLLLKVVELKRDVQNQQTRNAFSAVPADRQTYNSEAVQLQGQAEIFHRDVITASRRAQLEEEERFFVAAEEAKRSPDTTWYSIITNQKSSSSDSDADTISDTASTAVERDPLLAVAHVRGKYPSTTSLDSPENNAYTRLLIFNRGDEYSVMVDPNPCYLTEEARATNESTLLDMSRAGEAILAKGSNSLKDYEVIETSEEPTWMDSFIDTMARLGAGVKTTTV